MTTGRQFMTSFVALIVYASLTWVYCGVFLNHRGLYGETVWVELSQTRSWFDGFFYPYDPLRRLMSVPYQVAFLTSDGSYGSLNLLFALSVFATGALTYWLVRALMPSMASAAFAAGAIALTHGADRTANFVPIVQVRQAVVAALAATVLFVIASRSRRAWLLAPMAAGQVISLWTYEAALPALLAVPLLTRKYHEDSKTWLRWSSVWEVAPTVFLILLLRRYALDSSPSYQTTKFAAAWSIGILIRNTAVTIGESLAFWRWPLHWMHLQIADCWDRLRDIANPAIAACLGTAAAAAWMVRADAIEPPPRTMRNAAGIACCLILLCAVPFSILRDTWVEGGPWRTQFFVAVPSAVLLALIIESVRRRSLAAAVVLFTAIVGCGVVSGLIGQMLEMVKWREYRRVMASIVDAAPRLRQDSMVVVVDVPAGAFHSLCATAPPFDPFSGDQMWFNSGLQVLYPGTRLVGLYWTREHTSPGSIEFKFGGDGARLARTSITVKGEHFGYDQMLAFEYDPDKGARLMERFPFDRIRHSIPSPAYHPSARILPGAPSPETVRKLAER